MKIFRELRIRGTNSHLQNFAERISSGLPNGWRRAREHENAVSRQVDAPMFCFECNPLGARKAASLWLAFDGPGALYVSNVVPTESTSLGYDEYNSIVDEFYRLIVTPAFEGDQVKAELGHVDVGLEEWLDAKSAELLRAFSVWANKSTGATHPCDQQRWHAFIISAHANESELDAHTLARWLHEQDGWPESTANDLAIEYEQSRALLRAYDESGNG